MRSVRGEIHISADPGELTRTAAEEFVRQAAKAIESNGRFTVALSGGSTPKGLYTLLASKAYPFRERVPWGNIHFFWGDERHVPPDHPESNYRMVHDGLLSQVPVPTDHVHRIPAENPDAGKAAEEYEHALCEFFGLEKGEWPRFDLVLLGMGPDGHIASLFPGTAVLDERKHLVAASWVEKLNTTRITLTPPVLNNAACVVFLISGEEKAETLRTVLTGDFQPVQLPAQLIRPGHGRLLWLVDRAAAGLLDLHREIASSS
ncbi:MAG TPA: 6-phosphogluconolactonase [Candidatus Methylomirabilis sp.]|nr:6-phosphogluconolactonase [Candidatus Methylomirabilis sp.]